MGAESLIVLGSAVGGAVVVLAGTAGVARGRRIARHPSGLTMDAVDASDYLLEHVDGMTCCQSMLGMLRCKERRALSRDLRRASHAAVRGGAEFRGFGP